MSRNSEWQTRLANQDARRRDGLPTLSTSDSSESLLSVVEEPIMWLDRTFGGEASASRFANDAMNSRQAIPALCPGAVDLLNPWQNLCFSARAKKHPTTSLPPPHSLRRTGHSVDCGGCQFCTCCAKHGHLFISDVRNDDPGFSTAITGLQN